MTAVKTWITCSFGACIGLATALAADPASSAGETGAITGKVAPEGKKADAIVAKKGAYVFLGKADALERRDEQSSAVLEQRSKLFEPDCLAIQAGDTVAFPNYDPIFHNVFSLSRAARFDLGLYKSGDSRTVKFRRPGKVAVLCNIHPDMYADVLVAPNKFFTKTDEKGNFSLDGVPPGEYTLNAYCCGCSTSSQQVTVTAGGNVEASLKVSKGNKSLSRTKDGSMSGRYK
jgi:plastocyanin